MQNEKELPEINRCACGAIPSLKANADLTCSGNHWLAWVACAKCGLQGPTNSRERSAIRGWNKQVEAELSDE